MTSYDRHASHNSPYRTGQHVPLPQNRDAPLTSVATNADESRTDLSSTLQQDPNSQILGAQSPPAPYSPGMRSAMQRAISEEQTAVATKGTAGVSEIQMQAYSDGLPPPPPVSHSWKRIDRWAEDNYEELLDNLGEGCTQNDINELEHELDCTLPMEVRESLQVHDGQERGGRPTGVLFSAMLLDCEEIVEEWKTWRRVGEELLTPQPSVVHSEVHPKAFAGPSSSHAPPNPPTQAAGTGNSNWREELLVRQDSQPSNAVQKVYSHSSWIPLARDWGGNCLAVDLAPGPAGRWGQVILMGRDYDCKYVVARSWAAFLATVADDLGTSKVFVNEETGELKLREFKQQNVEPGYLDILRWRADQKFGRKPPKRKAGPNGEIKSPQNAASAAAIARGSPYASPTSADGERGRSPQRFPSKGMSTSSPRGVSSPLARVAEEAPSPIKTHPAVDESKPSFPRAERLISTDSPRASVDTKAGPLLDAVTHKQAVPSSKGKENVGLKGTAGLGMNNVDIDASSGTTADELKTVEI